MKYTCQLLENSLDELGRPKNPNFDPSHASVASFSLVNILQGFWGPLPVAKNQQLGRKWMENPQILKLAIHVFSQI